VADLGTVEGCISCDLLAGRRPDPAAMEDAADRLRTVLAAERG
jgi:hypothetical protein